MKIAVRVLRIASQTNPVTKKIINAGVKSVWYAPMEENIKRCIVTSAPINLRTSKIAFESYPLKNMARIEAENALIP